MINVSHVYKRFNGQVILEDINLDIREGEILVVLGESGSGKTVLLRHLIGLLKPDRGTITIDDVDITRLSERELLSLRRRIGYLFQEGALYDFMTVDENVAFPLKEHTSFSSREIREKVNGVLEMVDLTEAANKFPSQLSGGMKKRAALARSIILDTKILFCDEPTSGLDPLRSRDISELIRGISKKLNCTTVVTSHDTRNSFRIADRLALIHEGRILAVGTPGVLQSSQDSFVQEFFSLG
jgi:phospholipid/cholesterol/gamma-HCH transport system ATP-binding protein